MIKYYSDQYAFFLQALENLSDSICIYRQIMKTHNMETVQTVILFYIQDTIEMQISSVTHQPMQTHACARNQGDMIY